MLHGAGTPEAWTVGYKAHTVMPDLSSSLDPPITLIPYQDFIPSYSYSLHLLATEPCYSQYHTDMLSEWQRVVADSMARKSSQNPSSDQLFSSLVSTANREGDALLSQRKRSRDLADVDGDDSNTTQRKKRRLRRDLITSRLSRPYATPATHIISRNAVRLGIWTGRRYIGRNVFRKAAILNSMRREKANQIPDNGIKLPKATLFRTIDGPVNSDIAAVDKKLSREMAANNLPFQQRASEPNPVSSPATTNYDVFDDEDIDPEADFGLQGDTLEGSESDSDDSDEMFLFNDIYSTQQTLESSAKDVNAWQLLSQRSDPLTG